MDINKTIGEKVRTIRTKKGISQDELAEKSSLTRPHISMIERGSVSLQIDTLQKIADALGVQIKELLE